MIRVESTHFFTEYYTDNYQVMMPSGYLTQNLRYSYMRLFKSNGVYIGSYSVLDLPEFLLKLYDPENLSSGEEIDQLIDRFLNLLAFL